MSHQPPHIPSLVDEATQARDDVEADADRHAARQDRLSDYAPAPPFTSSAAGPSAGAGPLIGGSATAGPGQSPPAPAARGNGRTVHGVLQTIRGMCADEDPYPLIDQTLAAAVELAKDIEAERDRYRDAPGHDER